jgi:calcium/calmodulin-dependent protein kinase I
VAHHKHLASCSRSSNKLARQQQFLHNIPEVAMTKANVSQDFRESLRLPFEMDGSMDGSSQTTMESNPLKPLQTEFLDYVRRQDSLSQLSFCVNDSASNKTFEQVYDMGKVLGEGGFALVYQCRHKQNQHTYAVKECILRQQSKGEEIRDEISALRRVRECPHFVRLLDVFEQVDRTFLVLEEMKGGDLLDKLAEVEVYEEWEARKLARTLLEAVAYCHKRRICHRDIKPENILLPRADDITSIKLADFGCAHQWKSPKEMVTLCGSPQYVAPEVVGDQRPEGEGYSCQCDLWSVGVVLFIVLGGYAPFESEDEHELLDLICTADYEFDDDYWHDVEDCPKDLIALLLVVDPKQRVTARQALQSSWLRRRDGDWIKELDDSNNGGSAFDVWLEKRNSRVSGGVHSNMASLALSPKETEPLPSSREIMSNDNSISWSDAAWNETSAHSVQSFAGDGDAPLSHAPMQDSSTANAFNMEDECAE